MGDVLTFTGRRRSNFPPSIPSPRACATLGRAMRLSREILAFRSAIDESPAEAVKGLERVLYIAHTDRSRDLPGERVTRLSRVEIDTLNLVGEHYPDWEDAVRVAALGKVLSYINNTCEAKRSFVGSLHHPALFTDIVVNNRTCFPSYKPYRELFDSNQEWNSLAKHVNTVPGRALLAYAVLRWGTRDVRDHFYEGYPHLLDGAVHLAAALISVEKKERPLTPEMEQRRLERRLEEYDLAMHGRIERKLAEMQFIK